MEKWLDKQENHDKVESIPTTNKGA